MLFIEIQHLRLGMIAVIVVSGVWLSHIAFKFPAHTQRSVLQACYSCMCYSSAFTLWQSRLSCHLVTANAGQYFLQLHTESIFFVSGLVLKKL